MSEYGPEFDEFSRRCREELLPKIKDSDICMSIVPNDTDIKFAVELGLSIMLNKPIVALIPPGRKIPEKLARVVDRFVELDLNDPSGRQRLEEVLREMTGETEN